MRKCPIIKRYKVFSTQVNLSAYADDLNLVLQYDETSLRRILEILNEFKLLSGLTVQTAKTQCMVFGLQDNERVVKLCTDYNMTWTPQIQFLGVILDGKYIHTDINYELKLTEIKKVLSTWDFRHMTPFGKKLIVNQLCLSKLSHLAISLPNLKKEKIKEIEKLLKIFIWGSEKCKIAWNDTKFPPSQGGMGMFCIESSWESYKLKWISKAIQNPNSLWVRILNDELNTIIPGYKIENIEFWSKTDFDTIITNIGSIFWKEVFSSFLKGFHVYVKKYKTRLIMTNIWENPLFKYNQNTKLTPNNPVYKKIVPYAFQFIKDKLNDNDFVYFTRDEMRAKYPEFNVSILQYERIILAIKRCFIINHINTSHVYNDSHPMHGPALSSFAMLQSSGCNRWSKLLKYSKINKNNIVKRERKWEDRMGIRNRRLNWSKLYRLNEKIKFCNTLRFFHLLILKGNLETNTRSVHYRSPTELCTFCNRERETNLHLLWDCNSVTTFRQNVVNEISNSPLKHIITNTPNTPKARILGTHFKKPDDFAFIFFLSLNRYIWLTKLREGNLNLVSFKNHFNAFVKLQKSAKILSCINNYNEDNFWV